MIVDAKLSAALVTRVPSARLTPTIHRPAGGRLDRLTAVSSPIGPSRIFVDERTSKI
jgi:hypothetical protein